MTEIFDWLKLAEKFCEDGDAESMIGAANEILELDANSADGLAVLAEANLYLGELEAAENFARKAGNLRGRLVLGGVAAERFEIDTAIKNLGAVIDEARELSDRKILFKALAWGANPLYLAGDAERAAEFLREAATLTENLERAAELYSKHLFFRSYNAPVSKAVAQEYDKFFAAVAPHAHAEKYSHKKIRIGYVSPDFRHHAVANFVAPLLKDFDAENFSVAVYHTGKSDSVTAKLKRQKVSWRNLNGVDAETAARIIHDDEIDILVDLSGHTQNSCLPILAHKPAPIQITAVGFMGTSGLSAVDYFLGDNFCAADDFTEKILRVDGCRLCYSPILKMPAVRHAENDFVTFGSFNNFAKANDAVLKIWLEILRAVPNSRLILKNKTCSIPEGREIIRRRLRDFPLDRIELRPFSRDYLEQYNGIDVALDTFPYGGGLTTCEALFMGVPVVALKGGLGESILTAAGLPELIAENFDAYIRKAAELARRKDLLADYHGHLRDKLLKSKLMDERRYAREVERCYLEVHKLKWNA